MKKLLALGLATTMVATGAASLAALTGCSDYKDDGVFRVGFICLHDETSTYDNNFIEAAKKATKGLNEDQVIIKTGVDETKDCFNAAKQLVKQGCDVIFADSFGHEPFMIEAAKKYPQVQFCHATGTKAHTEKLDNYHNAFASIYEGRYLAGVAAGTTLLEKYGADITDAQATVGYVGAFNYAEVISGYTSWFLGVRSVVPNATMKVRYTNSWYDLDAENTAANTLITTDKCTLISQHADSMGAPNACQTASVPNVSYNGLTGLSTNVASSKIDWTPYFNYMIGQVQAGKAIDVDWVGTVATGSVVVDLGANASAGVKSAVELAKAGLANGTIKVFDVSKFTIDGKAITEYMADVDDMGDYQPETNVVKTAGSIKYVAESEFRSAPYFASIIDGITELK